MCAAGAPAFKGQTVEGGERISWKFPFASGCWHASWRGLSIQVEDNKHDVIDQVTAFAPISELEIEDTWFLSGMCGTGSNTLVAKDVFVPEHRVSPMTKLLGGKPIAHRHSGEPSDHYPFSTTNSVIGVSPITGIAQGILEKLIEDTCRRGIAFTTYTRQADSPVVQHEQAEASLKIDSAWLQVMRSAAEVEEIAKAAGQMDYLARARVRGVVGYAAQLIREAIDVLRSIGCERVRPRKSVPADVP
jgi:3-hydroxy-9,10-secoandrosta-1,3,5(10)-triene-9,17-dione monooxygenase